MLDCFHLGGFNMYPTTIAGLVLVATAARYARTPESGRPPLCPEPGAADRADQLLPGS